MKPKHVAGIAVLTVVVILLGMTVLSKAWWERRVRQKWVVGALPPSARTMSLASWYKMWDDGRYPPEPGVRFERRDKAEAAQAVVDDIVEAEEASTEE